MSELPLGLDISQYNTEDGVLVDFDVMASRKVRFCAARSGVSWGYQDKWFPYYWSELERVRIPRMAYHVIYPGESATRQYDNMMKIIQPGKGEKLVLDMELEHGQNKARITATTLGVINHLYATLGEYPVIYSRANWINENLELSDLPEVDLWLAQYRYNVKYPAFNQEAKSPPALPKGAKTWKIHQTGSQLDGHYYGASKYWIDTNRFNGSLADLDEWFKLPAGTVPLTLELLALKVSEIDERVTALEGI